ncbi:MAG: hypothetical protein A2X22_03090 [Bacteroidetes bacterium GWF2_49_14]|nr:MAG: hypothetical protein A2X22_03090 [Bacteroidetes bacterium GWF2_49_14]HBB90877.1 hypothetical protein [Bacteroidales bacterium]
MKKLASIIFIQVVTYLSLAFLLVGCGTRKEPDTIIEKIHLRGQDIPLVHLGMLPDSAEMVPLSDFFEEMRIIRLETHPKCMIVNTMVEYTGHSFLISTQQPGGAGPCRVMEFDLDGRYLRDFGKGGKGPGEHVGYFSDHMRYYPSDNKVFIAFTGMRGNEWQMFSSEGRFLKTILNPNLPGETPERFNDTTWLMPGASSGVPWQKTDSSLLIIYNEEGEVINDFPRISFPPRKGSGYSPKGWGSSLFPFNDEWHLYNPGDDTLYGVGPDKLQPLAIFKLGPNGEKFNTFISPEQIPGTYYINFLLENKGFWIIKKSITTAVNLHENMPGRWGGMHKHAESIIWIKKDGKYARNVKFEDNMTGLFPPDLFANITLHWKDNYAFFVLQAVSIQELLEKQKPDYNMTETTRQCLDYIRKNVTIEDNPVIFMMKLKKTFQ